MGTLQLSDGRAANVVLVGSRQNAKGAVLLVPGIQGQVETFPLSSGLDVLHPQHVIDILLLQERAFGLTGLVPPKE